MHSKLANYLLAAVMIAAIAGVASTRSHAGVKNQNVLQAQTVAQAAVLSMRAWHDVPEVRSPSVKYDVVAVKIANRSRLPSVKFELDTCSHAAYEPANVVAVSDSGILTKPYSQWAFRLQPGATKKVVFRIAHPFDIPYCAVHVVPARGKNAQGLVGITVAQSN